MTLTADDGCETAAAERLEGQIRAAQYLRMSDAQQHYSIACQREINADYAARRGYVVVRTYVDEARSGVTIKGRDGLKALLGDVLDAPDYSAVLVTDVSRWGRFQDPDEAAHYEFLCRQAGVQVIYCAEVFDNDGGQASMILKSVKRVMAAEFSRQLSARTRAGMRRAQIMGECSGGPAAYGFAKEAYDPATGRTHVLVPGERKAHRGQTLRFVPGPTEEVAVVREIFRRYGRGGQSPLEIARHLNGKGTAYRGGTDWTSYRVRAILDNELVVGIQCFGKSHYQFGDRRRSRAREDWSRVRIFPPLVAPALFARASARRALQARRTYTDDALIEDLRRLIARHGRVTEGIVAAWGLVSPRLYGRRFGTLGTALRLAGQTAYVRAGRTWQAQDLTWDRVRPALERLLDERGYLSASVIDACPYVPRSKTLKTYFGSLPALFAAVGDPLTKRERISLAWVRRGRQNAAADRPAQRDQLVERPSIQPAWHPAFPQGSLAPALRPAAGGSASNVERAERPEAVAGQLASVPARRSPS